MSTVIPVVVGDTAPDTALTVERVGTVINLTGAAAILIITNERTGEVTNSGHQTLAITDAINGLVTYVKHAGDFPDEGRYLGEVQVTYNGGGFEHIQEMVTFPARLAGQ